MIMSDLFNLYERECLPELTLRVQRDYRHMLRHLDDVFGYLEPQQVKPRHVVDFLNVKTGKVHRNRMVMVLSSIFKRAMGSWCIELDLVNPCVVARRHPTKPRTRYVTDEEFQGFRATAPASVQIAMDLALLTGQRQGDILALRWDQIHDGEIWIDQGKSGGERKLAIVISPALEAVLTRARALEPQLPREYVVHTMFGRRYTGDGFRALWQVYMCAWRKAHPNDSRWVFHDIRAKCVSDTTSLQDASLRAGHADPRITSRVYDRNRRRVEALR